MITDREEIDAFLAGHDDAALIYRALEQLLERLGPFETRVTKSQIAFRRRRGFAWVWIPGRYLRSNVAPLVLSLALTGRDASPRWKEVVETSPGRWMHHLELHSPADIDGEVIAWLKTAWQQAGA